VPSPLEATVLRGRGALAEAVERAARQAVRLEFRLTRESLFGFRVPCFYDPGAEGMSFRVGVAAPGPVRKEVCGRRGPCRHGYRPRGSAPPGPDQ